MENSNPTLTLSHCLDLVQSFLAQGWMRKFLLGDGKSSSDLSILTSKQHIRHACVGNLNVDFSSGSSFHNLFSQNCLVVPAFCFGNYSACILTQDRHANIYGDNTLISEDMKRIWASRSMFSHVIRDEASGTMVKVDYEDPNDANIMVVTIDRLSKSRQRAVFRIEKNVLDAGDIDAMKESVAVFSHISDCLACSVCSPLSTCLCEKPKDLTPSHPMDLAVVSNNVKLMAGLYTGTVTSSSTRSFQDDPQICVIAELIDAKAPNSLFKRLHSWTISHALTKYFAQPLPMPPFSTQLVATAYQCIAEDLSIIDSKSSTLTSNNSLSTRNNNSTTTFDDPFQVQPSPNRDDLLVPFSSAQKMDTVDPRDPLLITAPFAEDNFEDLPVSLSGPTIIPAAREGGALNQPSLPKDSWEAKDRIRRLRNRESAARSNMKKRQKIAALKKATADIKDYQVQLKEKFKQLEQVNKTLLRQVEAEKHDV